MTNIAFVTKLAGFEYTSTINPNLTETGIPLFKGKNVQNGVLIEEFESYIPEDISDSLPRSQLNKKALLVPYVGTIGNIAIFNGNYKAHLGSNVGKIEIHNTEITNIYEEYILYYLMSSYGLKELTKHKKATAQESISIDAIRDVYIPIPPLNEQEKIINKIKICIENINNIIIEKKNLSNIIDICKRKILDYFFSEQSCYKSYYYYNTEKLIKIAELITKGSTPTTYGFDYLDEGVSFVKVENVKNGRINHSSICQYISFEAHEFQKRSQLQKNDVLFSIAGTIGRTCIVYDCDLPANTNQAFAIIRGFEKYILPEYLEYYLKWYLIQKTNLQGHGAGMLNVTLSDLKNLKVNYPLDMKYQKIIVDKIKNIETILNIIS